jgi:hypothetical protein
MIDPDYARIYTKVRILAWQYGWTAIIHGSVTRDLDILLIPWEEKAENERAEQIIRMLAESENLKLQGEPSNKPHGRKAWTLIFPEFGDPRWVDISWMPTINKIN